MVRGVTRKRAAASRTVRKQGKGLSGEGGVKFL
jgi:hypothetical protein